MRGLSSGESAVHGWRHRADKVGATEIGRAVWTDDTEVLDLELERSLVFWRTKDGQPHRSLRTREDWAWAWLKWAEVLLPKTRESLPGRRPAAMYAAGIIPARPLMAPLPMSMRHRGVIVAGKSGEAKTHFDLPEPWQRFEAMHLADHGMIDDDELRRWRQSAGDGRPLADRYTFEVARYR